MGTQSFPDLMHTLSGRVLMKWRTAHVLVDPDYWCLDINVRADTPEALYEQIRQTVATMDQAAVLPRAPEEAWLTLSRGPVDRIDHFRCPRSKTGRLRVVMVKP